MTRACEDRALEEIERVVTSADRRALWPEGSAGARVCARETKQKARGECAGLSSRPEVRAQHARSSRDNADQRSGLLPARTRETMASASSASVVPSTVRPAERSIRATARTMR